MEGTNRRELLAMALRGDKSAISNIKAEKDPDNSRFTTLFRCLSVDEYMEISRAIFDNHADEWPAGVPNPIYLALVKTKETGRRVELVRENSSPDEFDPFEYREQLYQQLKAEAEE